MSVRIRSALLAWAVAASLEGCLWDTSLGQVDAADSGMLPMRSELDGFALRLVGTFRGTAGADDIEVTQEFRVDGSYSAACLDTASTTPAIFCPFYGVTGDGRYQLTGIEVSGAVNATTWDIQLGVEVQSRLNFMRLSADGNTLTYLRVATLPGPIANQIRASGISLTESAGASLLRNYMVLTRQP